MTTQYRSWFKVFSLFILFVPVRFATVCFIVKLLIRISKNYVVFVSRSLFEPSVAIQMLALHCEYSIWL